VTIKFDNGYKVIRDRMERRKDSTHLKLERPDGKVIEKAKLKDTQTEIENVLGIDYETYARTTLLSSTATLNFINSDDKSKRIIIERLLGCEKFGDFDEAAKEEKKMRESEKHKFEKEVREVLEEKALKLNDIANCDLRIRTKSAEIEELRKANRLTERQLEELLQQDSALETTRQTQLDAIAALQQEREDLDDKISQGNKSCSTLRKLESLGRNVRDAKQQVKTLEDARKLMTERLRMQTQKNAVETVVDAVKHIKEKELSKLGFNEAVVNLANRLDEEVIEPLEKYLDADQNGQKSKRDVELKNLEMKLRVKTQELESAEKQVIITINLFDQFLDEQGWADADERLQTLETLQNAIGQWGRKKERLEQEIKVAKLKLPPSDEKMADMISNLHRQIEQRNIKMECNVADIDGEKKKQASIRPSIGNVDEKIQFMKDTKGADIEHSIQIANFWVAALCPGKMKQVNGFRSFCLGKQMEYVNRLLSINMDLMCEDADGVVASDGVDLSCELTENLQIVEKNKGIAIAKRSDGQRRRTHLAIFLTLFTIAQRRLAFHPSFLFLDEVFDSLDEQGQASVQKWVHSLVSQQRNPVKKVFVITHSNIRIPSSGGGGTILVTRDAREGSNYELMDAPNNDDMFCSSHGYRFNKRKRIEVESDEDEPFAIPDAMQANNVASKLKKPKKTARPLNIIKLTS
jgi:DNA repair exonuclease SbcCD ATPase subunit